jgi:hypothetical protein
VACGAGCGMGVCTNPLLILLKPGNTFWCESGIAERHSGTACWLVHVLRWTYRPKILVRYICFYLSVTWLGDKNAYMEAAPESSPYVNYQLRPRQWIDNLTWQPGRGYRWLRFPASAYACMSEDRINSHARDEDETNELHPIILHTWPSALQAVCV